VALIWRSADDRIQSDTNAIAAFVVWSARIVVIAGGMVRFLRDGALAGRWIAGADVALVLRRADDGARAGAGAALAGVYLGTRVSIGAGGAVRLARVRAQTGRGVASTRDVALILRKTEDRVGAHA
jgi:hypothetical protein